MSECLRCKKSDVHLIQITDHPDCYDGMYCEDCNPYERDRIEAGCERKVATEEALDSLLQWAEENRVVDYDDEEFVRFDDLRRKILELTK